MTTERSQYLLVLADWFSKLTRAMSTSKAISALIAKLFLDDWIVPLSISTCKLSNNGPQLVSKVFSSTGAYLGLINLTSTAYHPQTNGKVERYN